MTAPGTVASAHVDRVRSGGLDAMRHLDGAELRQRSGSRARLPPRVVAALRDAGPTEEDPLQ